MVAEVVDAVVLGGVVVPQHHIPLLPVPAEDVVRAGDAVLEDVEQVVELTGLQTEETLDEVAEQQGPLARLRVQMDHRVLGLEGHPGELGRYSVLSLLLS